MTDNFHYQEQDAPRKGAYYIPLADLLTGLVFVLVILLTSTTITSRPEFEEHIKIENMRENLTKRLSELKNIEQTYVIPRESSIAGLSYLLEMMQVDLRSLGLHADIDVIRGILILDYSEYLSNSEAGQYITNSLNASKLGVVLNKWLKCFSNADASAKDWCANLPKANILRATIIVNSASSLSDDIAESGAKASIIYGSIMASHPTLSRLVDSLNRPILDFIGYYNKDDIGLKINIQMQKPSSPSIIWDGAHE